MDFALNEHQREVQRRAREFAASQIAPVASALDREGRIPPDIEISKGWAALGAVVAVHNSLVCYPISRYGDAFQKKTYLSRLTDEKQLGCYAFAEPSAGSDAGAIRTTAPLVSVDTAEATGEFPAASCVSRLAGTRR